MVSSYDVIVLQYICSCDLQCHFICKDLDSMFSAPTDFSICSVEDEADLAPGSAPPLGLDWAASLPRGSIASRYLFCRYKS